MKRLFFLDHSFYDVEEPYCRGCFMEQNSDKLPEHIKPIYDNGNVVVRQDAEWPIPAFYIISIHKHIGAFDKLDAKTRFEISEALYWVRKGIRENFGIERAQIYHEEKISSPSSKYPFSQSPIVKVRKKTRAMIPRKIGILKILWVKLRSAFSVRAS